MKTIKPGTIIRSSPTTAAPTTVTFAPNVTPTSYVAPPEDDDSADSSSIAVPVNARFLPSSTPFLGPTKPRREKKRRPSSHIPRPPNAFMLFRADFVKAKHVPGSIEANHGTLSKIIGACWKSLPADERKVWEVKAKEAKAMHKKMYPDYRFKPVHNKNKEKERQSGPYATVKRVKVHQPGLVDDDRRSEGVAQLLLQGHKGEDLAREVKRFDAELEAERKREEEERLKEEEEAREREEEMRGRQLFLHQTDPSSSSSQSHIGHRRSSSVPLPGMMFAGMNMGMNGMNMTIPEVPSFFPPSFPPYLQEGETRANSFSRMSRKNSMLWLGASSAQGGQGTNKRRRRSSSLPRGFGSYHHQQYDFAPSYPGAMQMEQSYSYDSTMSSDLPEVNNSLWNPGFEFGGEVTDESTNNNSTPSSLSCGPFSFTAPGPYSAVSSSGESADGMLPTPHNQQAPYDFSSMYNTLGSANSRPVSMHGNPYTLEVSPLDPNPTLFAPKLEYSASSSTSASTSSYSHSDPGANSPALSESSLPGVNFVVAPKPQYALGSPVDEMMEKVEMHSPTGLVAVDESDNCWVPGPTPTQFHYPSQDQAQELDNDITIKSHHSSPDQPFFFHTPAMSPLEPVFPHHQNQHQQIQLEEYKGEGQRTPEEEHAMKFEEAYANGEGIESLFVHGHGSPEYAMGMVGAEEGF